MRMKLARMVNTHPDRAVDISQMMQIIVDSHMTEPTFHFKRLNTAVTYATQNLLENKHPAIDLESLLIIGYSEAAFANYPNLTS